MIVKQLIEHHLEFLALKGGCGGSSESTLVKMSNCWKSQSTAHKGLPSEGVAPIWRHVLLGKSEKYSKIKMLAAISA